MRKANTQIIRKNRSGLPYATEEKLQKINKRNKIFLDLFLSYLRLQNKSQDILRVYETNIKIFLVWLLNYRRNKNLKRIKNIDKVLFKKFLNNTLSLSQGRVHNIIGTVNGFLIFLQENI
ncbi:hypothetical protein BJV85_002888 [Clostridium acetobutylicum]|uniref:Core-binding (CB) domain-containing protein n=1 Tax=Clostridium acetobutylicum (strain ATCC 824 / DSM 792 / JCM 1419 / IAM 19013 / LMG 5710 / NBRC 13948 / NRRL B-527 / VKM B-1787 / 2291 / W) TaxID=272562 RepID=Q97K10_CLOAB|nr:MULTISPECIES: hypothetical protein [Clostridium]AAK79085.1 Hypothetical protein, CF-10 family [Clostridium acetobutylicum ATCC 824]ADZ20160.1 conserved hypothetical protein [Clostridium acetobutylicum EA 2018]AEI31622.1 hypothetical protein SMB_G1129 [Clostridium acetobutylicum DSM 1731]AWV81661.1 hypothetical protein DK921_16500 [Clostridium acetobutylicum]MBC2393306.1 hypothetical protein [Clostridium acetobutylicum]